MQELEFEGQWLNIDSLEDNICNWKNPCKIQEKKKKREKERLTMSCNCKPIELNINNQLSYWQITNVNSQSLGQDKTITKVYFFLKVRRMLLITLEQLMKNMVKDFGFMSPYSDSESDINWRQFLYGNE